MLKSAIIKNGDAFLIQVNEERLPMYGYLTYHPEKGDYQAFKEVGVRLFFCTVYAGDRGINQYSGTRPFRSGFWKGYNQYDFSEPNADFRRIVGDSKPGEIFIIPRMMVEAPSWWEELNPNELCRDAHGTPVHQSFHSEKWISDVEQMMVDFQHWLEKSGWDRYVIGWHIAAGNTEEFIRPFHRPDQMTDYSIPAQEGFRLWAKKKYVDLSKLNLLWHSSYASFDEIRIPSPAKRLYGIQGDYHKPDAEREVLDYYAFMNEAIATAAVKLCSAAKRATGEQQIIGAFYGYLICDAESGQHASSIVYQSDAVDFIASPFVYTDSRAVGIDWQFQGSVDSAALHGKPWFMEADVRTFLSRPISVCFPKADPYVSRAYDGPVWYGPDTVEKSLGQMLKAFSRVLTNNTAIWWFDMWGGWYNNPQLMEFHKKAYSLYVEQVLAGGCRNRAEIALFMDDEAFFHFCPGNAANLHNHAFWKEMGFVGVPYRMFTMDDFPKIDPKQYRMAIFSTSFAANAERLCALEKWKGADRVLVFLDCVDHSTASGIRVLEEKDTEYLPANQLMGEVRTPVVRLCAEEDDILFEKDERGVLSLLRRYQNYSVYAEISAVPKANRIRSLMNAAGGQLYTCGGDIAYASHSHIALHAATDGIKRVHFPEKYRAIDEMTGNLLPGNECFVDVRMNQGDTLLIRLEQPEKR